MSKAPLYSLAFAGVLLLSILIGSGPLNSHKAAPTVATPNELQEQTSVMADSGRSAAYRALASVISQVAPRAKYLQPDPEKLTNPIPAIGAKIAIVKELGSPFSFFDQQGGQRWPIASITKLLTAGIAFEQLTANTPITFSEHAIAQDGDQGGFKLGETYRLDELVAGMLEVSSNDAAMAIAEKVGLEKFVGLMNKKVEELKMPQTAFVDPTGLSPQNLSTARELEKLASYVFTKHPELLEMTNQAEIQITEQSSKTSRTIASINEFSGKPGFIGGKTGFIDEARGNLFSLFSKQGRTFVIIVMGTETRFSDTQKLYDWLLTAINE